MSPPSMTASFPSPGPCSGRRPTRSARTSRRSSRALESPDGRRQPTAVHQGRRRDSPPCAGATRRCSSIPASISTMSCRRSSSASSDSPNRSSSWGSRAARTRSQTARMLARAGAGHRRGRARCRARLRRHQLDARRGARRRPGGGTGRARRSGDAVVRPIDARGAQQGAHRSRRARSCSAPPRPPSRTCDAEHVAGRVELVGDVMVDVAQATQHARASAA